MSLPVVFLPEAEDDIVAGHLWYERQLAGLGDLFLEAVRAAVNRVRENPQMFGVLRRDIRAAMLSRFPYVVYYRDRGSDVLVIAVQYGGRSTRRWLGRA